MLLSVTIPTPHHILFSEGSLACSVVVGQEIGHIQSGNSRSVIAVFFSYVHEQLIFPVDFIPDPIIQKRHTTFPVSVEKQGEAIVYVHKHCTSLGCDSASQPSLPQSTGATTQCGMLWQCWPSHSAHTQNSEYAVSPLLILVHDIWVVHL